MAITKVVEYDVEKVGEWCIHVRRRDVYKENGRVIMLQTQVCNILNQ